MKIVKSLIKILLLISFSFAFFPNARGFLDSDLGLNLYDNIDKGFYDLEVKLFQKEIKGFDKNGEVFKTLNQFTLDTYGLEPCFKKGLEIKDPNQYIETAQLYKMMDKSCLKEDGTASVSGVVNYQKAINYFILISRLNSQAKAEQINSISRIGLYSDGDSDNSPFDIIVDLQEIDKIVFGEELEYLGEDLNFLSKFKKDPFYQSPISAGDGTNPDGGVGNNTGNNNDDGSGNGSGNNDTPDENGVCLVDESGLSQQELELLQGELGNNLEIYTAGDDSSGNSSASLLPSEKQIAIGSNFATTNYSSINDNSSWPCQGFFCIKINFSTYEHRLLGYGETKSIEGLLVKSNEHLKVIANTSALQTKMAINNGESVFKNNLDFQGLFHMGFQISSESPPVLNLKDMLNNNEKKQEDEDMKNGKDPQISKQLRKYYKALGLNYDRANDLNKFGKKAKKLQNLISSAELNPTFVGARDQELKNIEASLAKINNYTNDSIDKQINEEILKEFNLEFIELERFVSSMQEYTYNLGGFIEKFREIPIYK